MQTGRVDVHGHFLPQVDDGCATLEDALACGRMLHAAGYTHLFCTPHVWPGMAHNNVTEIPQKVKLLQKAFDAEEIGITLLPGGEINLLLTWPQLRELPRQEVVTYGLAGKYALFDFWAETWSQCSAPVEAGVEHLQSLGITLICAHPERVKAFWEPGVLEGLGERGVLFQLNSWCLAEAEDSKLYRMAEKWLKEGRYFLLGTDTHNFKTLPVRIEGVQRAVEMIGQKEVDRLTMENPRRLM